VDPAHQKRGIGTALIQRVLDFLEEQGARILLVWTLEADEPACRLYDRLGFEELTRFVYYSLERHGESEEKA
jgi:ribosomal protein S18 acetylase RimI-like enzyme